MDPDLSLSSDYSYISRYSTVLSPCTNIHTDKMCGKGLPQTKSCDFALSASTVYLDYSDSSRLVTIMLNAHIDYSFCVLQDRSVDI